MYLHARVCVNIYTCIYTYHISYICIVKQKIWSHTQGPYGHICHDNNTKGPTQATLRSYIMATCTSNIWAERKLHMSQHDLQYNSLRTMIGLKKQGLWIYFRYGPSVAWTLGWSRLTYYNLCMVFMLPTYDICSRCITLRSCIASLECLQT